jgi:hypothetical protein
MKIKVITSKNFRNKAKRLLKKYNSLKSELQNLEKQLYENPEFGISLGSDCYKIKLAVKSKGKGKSGGVRNITNVIIRITHNKENIKVVGLVTIYDKSEFENISDKEIVQLISELNDESENFYNE